MTRELKNILFVPHSAAGETNASDHAQQGSALSLTRRALSVFRTVWTMFMVVVTSLPYLINFASTPYGYHYTWILPPYPEDSFGYMAWSQQAARGALLFKIKYTALPQSAFLFQPFFLVCGWASSLSGVNVAIVGFVMKEIGVVLLFLAFYKYTDYLRLTAFQAMVATAFLGISSGVGGAMALIGLARGPAVISGDLFMPDMNTYWSLLWNPLFPYSLLLMLLTIYFVDRGTRNSRKSDMWAASVCSGVLALVHPYSQPLLLTLAIVIIAVRHRKDWLAYLARYLAAVIPCLAYLVLVSTLQPVVARHNSNGAMLSPAIQSYLLGFGIPLLIAIIGLVLERCQLLKRYWQLVLWFGLSLGFAYLPLWFQYKLIFGAHIPLCILAALSLDLALRRCLGRGKRTWMVALSVLIIMPAVAITPVYLAVILQRDVRNNANGVYYISNDLQNGFNFLKQHSSPNDIVMATVETSSLLPAYTGNTVLWGHWAMSVDFDTRRRWVNNLLTQQGQDDKAGEEFWGSGIQFVFADGALWRNIRDKPRNWKGILKNADIVFHNDSVVVYKHRSGC
jgi:hypothetical protein